MNRADANYTERIRKEFFAEYNAKDKGRDPFATTLASLVGGIPENHESSTPAEAAAPTAAGPAAAKSRLSRVSSRPDRSSQLSAVERGSRRGGPSSQISATQQRTGSGIAADDDMQSRLTMGTQLSWRTPSSIRSSEPSAIARNKIAELQLRVELERVLRLQKETELEQQRRENLLSQGGSMGGK